MRALLPWAAALVLAAVGCKDVGDRCEVSGDGFTRSDPCRKMCVEWEITCPDGRVVNPAQCAGDLCAEDADCEADQVCLQIDSVVANSRCMKASACAP